MTDPFARLTDQIIRFKWIVIGSWVAVIAVAALLLAPHATEVLQGGSLVIPGSESDRADELLRTRLDASSQNTAIVVIQSGDLTADSPAFKAQVTQAYDFVASRLVGRCFASQFGPWPPFDGDEFGQAGLDAAWIPPLAVMVCVPAVAAAPVVVDSVTTPRTTDDATSP